MAFCNVNGRYMWKIYSEQMIVCKEIQSSSAYIYVFISMDELLLLVLSAEQRIP